MSKFSHSAYSLLEKTLYSYERPPSERRKGDLIKSKSLKLLHQDILTPGFSEIFRTTFPTDANDIVRQADQTLDLVFDLLGSGSIDLKIFRDRDDLKFISPQERASLVPATVRGRIAWHFDFKTGLGWDPRTFFKKIRFHSNQGADIKVPWELSRCQHFVTLGQAYRLTHDEKYPIGFMNQVEDWIEQNPPKYGVNWSSPMDVALRACNWLLAWEFLFDSPSITDLFKVNFFGSLKEHGNHIYHHLEWGADVSTNHYLANLLGLAYLGTALSNPKWVNFSKKEFQTQIYHQTYDDGFNYEGSTSYHRLVLEMFFYFSLLRARQAKGPLAHHSLIDVLKEEMKEPFLARLRSMIQVIPPLARTDGRLPIMGDNDSGRVHVLLRRDDDDLRALVALGALIFKSSELKIDAWPAVSELVWFFGFSGLESYRALPGLQPNNILSKGPSPSGLISLRGQDDVMVISTQPNGTNGVGNHSHNDKLSFTLSVGTQNFFVDPGTGVYTSDPEVRSLFRSTRMHNTIEVDGEEQNRFLKGSLFSLENDGQVVIEKWEKGRFLQAYHTGYDRLADKICHHRSWRRSENPIQWVIQDEVQGKGTHRIGWSFILDPDIEVKRVSDQKTLLIGSHSGLQFQVEDKNLSINLQEVPFSPAYGKILKTRKLGIQTVRSLPLRCQFVLVWEKNLVKK